MTTHRPLDVLIIGLNYHPEPTGIAPYTTGLATGLAHRGHQVRVITGYPHYPAWRLAAGYGGLRTRERIDGVDVVRVRHPIPKRTTGPARVAMEVVFAAHAAVLGGRRPDVVLVASPALLSVVSALRWRGRSTAVGVISQDLYCRALTETGALGERFGRLAARLEAALLSRTDGVAVIHDMFRETVVSLGVDRDRVTVIRNWAHIAEATASRADVRARLGWSDNEIIALHAGNMGHKQGLENVIEAARRAEQAGSVVRFVLLGDGAQRATLERLGAGVRTLEFMDPLPDGEFENALAAADVLVLNEKVGIAEMCVPGKLTSYFASGRPVVAATDPRSGAAFEVDAAGAGMCVPPGDPAALLAAVLATGRNRAAAAELGAHGRTYAVDLLGADAAIAAYDRWLTELVAGRRGRTAEADGQAIPIAPRERATRPA